MESTWLLLALAGTVALAFLSKALTHKRLKLNHPPGPKPWPIIGNLNLLGSIPHQSLHLLFQKYGEIMQLKFGSSPVVVASSPEMAKEFLQTHDNIFASRPATAAAKYTSYNCSGMLWAPYGPHWRQARKIYLTQIFSPKQLDFFESTRIEERRAFISRLYAQSGKPVVMRDHLMRLSLSTASQMVLSNKYFAQSEGDGSLVTFEEFQEMIDTWFLLGGVFNIGDWIPWLDRFDLQGYVKQMKELYKKFDKFHNHVLDDHQARRKTEKDFIPKDMVDILLQYAEDPDLQVKLTRDQIKGLIQDLLVGGTDTSASTVEWAMNELLKHPHLIEKATEELDRVIGRDKWVEEAVLSKLPFLGAIIKETFRLHPLATLLPPHYALEDCTVAGYHIAKGTTVFINTWSMGRNSKYWDSPEEFIPERFLGKDIDIKGHDFELLPFGSGRRMCPGYVLALKLVGTMLTNLLHGFNWKLPHGMKPEEICMEEHYGLSIHPRISLAMIPEPRLPVNLY
ncbi:dimethylnonatriene synthase-like [Coffea arabica]|uniref:Dimethylnonatriene synthase-like n=1 Tax=Coffea arabica TaxID=13443 RepID=A0A6P6UB51_COFAR|nr:flavonoid 3'-monooxygenase-like [Coffea arabica]